MNVFHLFLLKQHKIDKDKIARYVDPRLGVCLLLYWQIVRVGS